MTDYNSPDYMRKLLESIEDRDGYEFDSREEAILDRAWSLVDLLAEYAEAGFSVIPDRDFRLAFVAEYQRLKDAKQSQDDGNLLAAASSFITKLDPFWLDDDFEKIEDRAAKLAIREAYRKLSNAVHDIMGDEDIVNEDEDLIQVQGHSRMRRDQVVDGAEDLAKTILNDIRRGIYSPSDADILKAYLTALADE